MQGGRRGIEHGRSLKMLTSLCLIAGACLSSSSGRKRNQGPKAAMMQRVGAGMVLPSTTRAMDTAVDWIRAGIPALLHCTNGKQGVINHPLIIPCIESRTRSGQILVRK